MPFGPNPHEIRRINKLIQSLPPQIAVAQSTYRDFERTMGATVRQVMSWYEAQIRALQPAIQQAASRYAALETAAEHRAVRILLRRGWFGVARHLDPFELLQSVNIYAQKGSAAFDKFVCVRFSRERHRRIQRVQKDWWCISYMKNRKPKIRAALTAYRQRKYSLAIPALLPMVEGLATAYFQRNPGLIVPRPPKQRKNIVTDAALLHPEARADYADLLLAALSKQIYKSYTFGMVRPPSTLNRHGILHGDIAKYDTEKNALLTILLLDEMCRVALSGPNVP